MRAYDQQACLNNPFDPNAYNCVPEIVLLNRPVSPGLADDTGLDAHGYDLFDAVEPTEKHLHSKEVHWLSAPERRYERAFGLLGGEELAAEVRMEVLA